MWTLKRARKHYQEQNPNCNSCSFSTIEVARITSDFYCINKPKIKCKVREEYVLDKQAKDCIYFTTK